jgi:hypothetical protein
MGDQISRRFLIFTKIELQLAEMSISRKRPRTSDVSETGALNETVASTSTVETPKKAKSHWRNRKRSTKSLSGTAKDSITTPARSWSVVNTYGGKFKPKSIFSKDEKYGSGY